jgi:hypothetical protein
MGREPSPWILGLDSDIDHAILQPESSHHLPSCRNLFLARMSIEHPQSLRYTCSRDPASTDCLSRCLSVSGSTHTNSTARKCIATTTSLHRSTLDLTLDQPVSMSTTVRCSSSDTALGGGLLPITSRADPEDRQQRESRESRCHIEYNFLFSSPNGQRHLIDCRDGKRKKTQGQHARHNCSKCIILLLMLTSHVT